MPENPEVGTLWTDGAQTVRVNSYEIGNAQGKTPKKWGAWTLTRKMWVGYELEADPSLISPVMPVEAFLASFKPVAQ